MESAVLRPVSLAFVDPGLEAEYWRRNGGRLRRKTAITILLVLVLYVAFGFLDPWIVPEILATVWALRAAVVVLCVILVALTRTRAFAKRHQLIIASLPVLGGVAIFATIALSGETGRLLYYAGIILAIIWTMLLSELRFPLALAVSVYLIAGYEVIAVFVSPLSQPVIVNNTFFLVSTLAMTATGGYTIERAARVNFRQSLTIEEERRKSEDLLVSMLPREVAAVLKAGPATVARRYEAASVLFADIVGFTTLSALMNADDVVKMLDELFNTFDSLVALHGAERIRTIGDSYMAAAGVPAPREGHAQALAALALDMQAHASAREVQGRRLALRVGISSGPLIAGVIGVRKPQYDVWGDTVNAASRMESHGIPSGIQVTRATYELIRGEFCCEPRGLIEVKGMGPMEVWFLTGRR
jgi:guanylate cyclase